MTILAVCGPIGSDFKAFSEQCYSYLNEKNTMLIDSTAHQSINSLLAALESAPGDVIVFGPDIFLDEKVREQFDIKVFLELDADLCLSNHLKEDLSNFNQQIDDYLTNIQPLNELIRRYAQFADVRRPQKPNDELQKTNEHLIGLLINKEKQSLMRINTPTQSLPRDSFWKPASTPQSATQSVQILNSGCN
ncbi:MAG: uridine kinase [Legionella sp.]